jgi:hypothetical protein
MATITMLPIIALSIAEAWDALLAPRGLRAPIRFPTLCDAATPIPRLDKDQGTIIELANAERNSVQYLVRCHYDGLSSKGE